MEEGEYPLQTAVREVMEEVGLELTSGRLLAVDWAPAQDDGRPAQASYAFDGGHLDGGEARQRVRLQPGELTGWTMAGPDEWDTLLAPHTERRIRACLEALAAGGTAYLHHGWPVTSAS